MTSTETKKTDSADKAGKAVGFNISDRLAKFAAPTVWHEFSPLAVKHKAVNLGQGFPGWSPPEFVKQFAADAVLENKLDFLVNQYERSAGRVSLVNNLAKKYSKTLGRELNPLTEIVVTNGATEAICGIALGLLNPGDEVVVFEPAFDIYLAQVELTGAVLKTVPLRVRTGKDGKKEWYADLDELKRAFTSKTRMFILNTPHNPTGKVFAMDELKQIAAIVQEFKNVVCVADEVYEHLTYDGHKHISIASLPGMFERTITVSSAGKTFSTTGWKIGWTIGPEHLVRCVGISHQWLAFSVCTPMQEAISRSLEEAEKPYKGKGSYYEWLNSEYVRKRAFMMEQLAAAGIEPVAPEGSFFIVGDTSKIQVPDKWLADTKSPHDWNLCRFLTVDIGVAAIPPSSFYCDENKPLAANLARFAFCKPDDVLEEAGKRLQKLKEHHKKS